MDEESLIKLIKNATCLIQPSLYEGFGIPPLEAMSLGTPVIVSDIPVFKEIYDRYPVIYFKKEMSMTSQNDGIKFSKSNIITRSKVKIFLQDHCKSYFVEVSDLTIL